MERKSSSTPLKDLFSKFGPAKKQETPKSTIKKPIKKLDLKKSAFNKAEEKKTKEVKPKKKVTKDKSEEAPSKTDILKKPDESPEVAQKPNEESTETKAENNDVTEQKSENEVKSVSDNSATDSKVKPEPDTKQLEFTIETKSTEEEKVVLEKDTEFNVTIDLNSADKENDKINPSDVKTVTKTEKIDNSVVAEKVPNSNGIQTVEDVESSDSIEELAKAASTTLEESDQNVKSSPKDEITENATPNDNKSPSPEDKEATAESIPQPETSKSDREREGSTEEKTGCENEADKKTSKQSDSVENEADLVGTIHVKDTNKPEATETVEVIIDNETVVKAAGVEEVDTEKEHNETTCDVIAESKEPDDKCQESVNDAIGESTGSDLPKLESTEDATEESTTTEKLSQNTDDALTKSCKRDIPDNDRIDDSNGINAENIENDDTRELGQGEQNEANKEIETPSCVKIEVPAIEDQDNADVANVVPSEKEEAIETGEIEAQKHVPKGSSTEDVKDAPPTTPQSESMESKAEQIVDEAMAAAVQEVVATVTIETNTTSTEEPEVKQVEADEEVTGIMESSQGHEGKEAMELTEEAETQPEEKPAPTEKPTTTPAKPANMPGESTILFTKTFTESITPNEFIPIEPRGDASLLPVFFTRSEAKKEENAAHPGTTIPHVHEGMTETTKKTVGARQEIYDIRAEMQRLRDMMRALDDPQKFITDY